MSQAQRLLQQGIQAAKAGQKDQARKLLQQSLKLDPKNDSAWLYLASVARDKRERLICLQKVLEIDPTNDTAIKAVRAMGIDPSQLVRPPEEPAVPMSKAMVEEDLEDDGSGVPIPSADRVEQAQKEAVQIIQAYLDAAQSDADAPEWTRKTRGRAGEREIALLRLQIGIAVVIFFALVGGGIVFAISNSPEVQLALFGATETPRPPTLTPTTSPTPTPGFTPTPSPTVNFTENPTFTPSPTLFPSLTPGRIEVTPRPTELFLPASVGNSVREAAQRINESRYEEARELAVQDREAQGAIFSPNAYYYEALAYLGLNQPDAALAILQDAQQRLDTLDGVNIEDAQSYQPLITLGFAEVNLHQGVTALESGDPGSATAFLEQAREQASQVIQQNPRYGRAYVITGETHRRENNFQAAIDALNEAQLVPALVSDERIVLNRGRVYLEWGQLLESQEDMEGAQALYDRAAYEGYYGVVLNPFNRSSHELKVDAALAEDDPGLGVIFSQDYLFYFPASAEGFRLLGDSRVQEGNLDQALGAYTLALQTDEEGEVIAEVLASRGELYDIARQYQLALNDFNQSLEIRESLEVREQRMRVAFRIGEYDLAESDAAALFDTGQVSNDELRLIQARILINLADADDRTDYTQALNELNQIGGELPAELVPVADEYRARAHLALDNLDEALNAINRAIGAVETGTRFYLRAQILQEQMAYQAALADIEWILTWSRVYAYPFLDDVLVRRDDIQTTVAELNAQATATSAAATQSVLDATATRGAEETATAEAATAEFFLTTSPTPTPSPTVTPTPTITPTVETTPEVTPEVTAEVEG